MRFLQYDFQPNGTGEVSVKEVFGLDNVSLLLKAESLFRKPFTFWGRAKPVQRGKSECLLSLTKKKKREHSDSIHYS